MKTIGMTFHPTMVKAFLDGRKNQTRRLIDPQPHLVLAGIAQGKDGKWYGYNGSKESALNCEPLHPECVWECPWQRGDRIYVQERWCHEGDLCTSTPTGRYLYESDGDEVFVDDGDGSIVINKDGSFRQPWHSAKSMPRKASRILLEVTEDPVPQRILEITEEDAKAEGSLLEDIPADFVNINTGKSVVLQSHRVGFSQLWCALYGQASLSKNEWVWKTNLKTLEVKARAA